MTPLSPAKASLRPQSSKYRAQKIVYLTGLRKSSLKYVEKMGRGLGDPENLAAISDLKLPLYRGITRDWRASAAVCRSPPEGKEGYEKTAHAASNTRRTSIDTFWWGQTSGTSQPNLSAEYVPGRDTYGCCLSTYRKK